MSPGSTAKGRAGTAWMARMAWRDSRGKRLLLFLFTLSIAFGIGAVVAILSLRVNLLRIVDEQARSLLGADLVLQSRSAWTPETERFIASLPGRKVRELRFRSMAAFPETGEARFVEVRALDGPLPFYGEMETDPAGPDQRMPEAGKAIVEESLVLQNRMEPGDPVRLGERTYALEAALVRMAGESEVTGFFAPRIYLPREGLEETGLLLKGAIIRHRVNISVEPESLETLLAEVEAAREDLQVESGVSVETVADRKQSIRRILNNLLDFLNLVGFIALLLGGVGIIGAVHAYLQGKRQTIAVLRCLGASSRTAFAIYLGQMLAFGLAGALAGTALGVGAQFIVPQLLAGFLPFPVVMKISYGAIATGLAFGWAAVALSALIPLLGIRSISPLRAIRTEVEAGRPVVRDPFAWIAGLTLLGGLAAFVFSQSRDPLVAASFLGGMAVALASLAALSGLLRGILKRLRLEGLPYTYRTALGNLYRPNNRTLVLLVSLGMGVLLLNTLLLTRQGLLSQVRVETDPGAANVILIDVQPDQRADLLERLEALGNPAQETLPMITMRVENIKGRTLSDWRADPDSPVSDWVYTWEFRNTYRDHVLDNAEVVAGTFTARHEGGEPYPISLAENLVEDLGVGVGDTLTWNVQGVLVESVVTSIRRVRWQAGRQNFGVVFALNTVEAAPTVYAVSVRTGGRVETAALQRDLMPGFPNVSLIDLSLVFESVKEVLDKAAFVIQFMAGFTLATGLVVTAGALLGNRYQRIRESVLYRTLGAPRRFIRSVLTLEFLLLGLLAGLAGILLSWLSAWALLKFVFQIPFQFQLPAALALLAGVAGLTWTTGWLTSRGIAGQPPLVILRKE